MPAPGARRDVGRAATFAVIALAAVIAVRNATVYPAIAGYDAVEAIEYAQGLVRDGRLPDATGSYYTPPGFFAIGGVAIEVGELLGLEHPERVGQVFNALAAVATLFLLLALVRLLWPGREVLHLAAIVFFVACPVVMKSAAMFHPEPLSMLLSTASLVLAARMLVRSDYRLRLAVALGLALGLAQLVRAWTLWTFGVVLLVLVVAAVTRPHDRRRLLGAIAVVAAVAILVPAPWYAHQLTRYDSALFGQPHPDEPVWSRRPIGFFVGAGLPEVVTAPYRPVVLTPVRADRVHRGVGRLLRRLAVAPDGRATAGRRPPRTRDDVDRRTAVHPARRRRLARPARSRRPQPGALRRAPARRPAPARRARRRPLLRDVVPDPRR